MRCSRALVSVAAAAATLSRAALGFFRGLAGLVVRRVKVRGRAVCKLYATADELKIAGVTENVEGIFYS